MGTNYYAQIIPTVKQKEDLKKAIDNNDVNEVKNIVDVLYNEGDEYSDNIHNIIHLGKLSGGWVFLWNPNMLFRYDWQKENTKDRLYKTVIKACAFGELTHKAIKDFIFREDVRLFDEYNEDVDKQEFWNTVTELEKDKNSNLIDNQKFYTSDEYGYSDYVVYPSTQYEMNLCAVGFNVKYREFYSDGMRFASTMDFS